MIKLFRITTSQTDQTKEVCFVFRAFLYSNKISVKINHHYYEFLHLKCFMSTVLFNVHGGSTRKILLSPFMRRETESHKCKKQAGLGKLHRY